MMDHPVIRNMERTGYADGHGPAVWGRCGCCGGNIHVGDTIYKVELNVYCGDCILEARTEAEEPEPDWGEDDG